MNWEQELRLAETAAKRAGALLRDALRRDKKVLSSEGKDIKLQADRDAEAVILEVLQQSAFNILAEESGEHGVLDSGEPIWIVDPLDGTLNFSRNIPLCCVSIALSRPDDPLVGVVYDFNADDCFAGIVGEGAWWNGEPMSVSNIGDAAQGILATGFPVNFVYSEAGLQEYLASVRRFKKVRKFGTAALSLAWVACGRADAYAEDDIMYWDVAGGLALVRAAGGYVRIEPSPTLKWARKVRCASKESVWTP